MAAAKAFATLSLQFNFVYISGEGVNITSASRVSNVLADLPQATRKPGRFSALFARVKGETETSLLSLIPTYPSLRIYNVRPAFIDDTGAKLKEGSKPFSYALMDKMAPVLRLAWPSAVSPTGKLAEVLLCCAEEQGPKEEVKKAFEGKGVTWEGNGDGVGVLIENVGMRRLAGL